MTNAIMTPDSAPRDLDQLSTQGPFIHRRLAEALGEKGFPCWGNDRERSAFMTAAPPARAQLVLNALLAYDGKGGGKAPAAAQKAETSSDAPSGGGGGGGTGEGTAAATGTPATRQPRTANGAGSANVAELLIVIKEARDEIKALAASDASALDKITGMVAASMKIQEVELGLLCLIGENILGAPMGEFIGEGSTYGTSALEALDQGKG